MATNPKLILWDLDGTLCPHNAKFTELAPQAIANAALEFDIPVMRAEAHALARKSFNGQRAGIHAFVEYFDLNEEKLFERYYQHLDPSFLQSESDLVTAFQNLRAHYTCGVLTHAPESWADKALARLGLRPYFNDNLIIGHGRLGGARKADRDGGIQLASILQTHNYQRDDIALVDDKIPVLEKLAPYARTRIWLKDRPDETACPHDILIATTPLEAINFLMAQAEARN